MRELAVASIGQDLGKIDTPYSVLNKHGLGRLSKKEYIIIEQHLRDSYARLVSIGEPFAAKVAVAHHEFGRDHSYPREHHFFRSPEQRFFDWKIDALAEVVAVADLVDALIKNG